MTMMTDPMVLEAIYDVYRVILCVIWTAFVLVLASMHADDD